MDIESTLEKLRQNEPLFDWRYSHQVNNEFTEGSTLVFFECSEVDLKGDRVNHRWIQVKDKE